MLKKKELLSFIQDRFAVVLMLLFLLLMVALILVTVLNTRSSDVQVPVRYSGYGVTNIYRDKWFALFGFALFALLVGGVNAYVAIKAHARQRGLALGVLGVSVVIGVVSLVVAGAVFRLAAAVL